ncbi:MAG: antibiotic biosynthesis monooxygenase [Acidobacteria bacterium]|nr:antibiotic biosynthesis monooxygenase [Acidobacteriota bacterium]
MLTHRNLIFNLIAGLCLSNAALAQDPVPIYPDNYKVLLENDRVRVLQFTLRKGATEDFHSHPAAVTYVLTPFKIRFRFPDGTERIREAKAGDVLYGEAVTHSPLNIGDTNAMGILVEMKTPPAAAKTKNTAPADELLTAVTFIAGMEGKEEELKGELLALSAATRAEPGNITYDLYQSPERKNEFLRFEVWRNPAALEEHKQTPHIKASFAKRQQQGWKTNITVWKRVAD